MGQRLAIFIYEEKNVETEVENKKGQLVLESTVEEIPLALAYYHWSAYTDTATALLQKVISFLEANSDELEENKLLYAIKALEATGAGLIPETDSMDKANLMYKNIEFQEAINRDKGLIFITRCEMENWYLAGNERIRINLTTKTVEFGVLELYKKENYFEERLSDYDENREPVFVNKPYDYKKLQYSQIIDFVKTLCEKKAVIFRETPDIVLEPIEGLGIDLSFLA